jgi:hypothetical protein
VLVATVRPAATRFPAAATESVEEATPVSFPLAPRTPLSAVATTRPPGCSRSTYSPLASTTAPPRPSWSTRAPRGDRSSPSRRSSPGRRRRTGHWSMGVLGIKRLRLQDRIEGSIEQAPLPHGPRCQGKGPRRRPQAEDANVRRLQGEVHGGIHHVRGSSSTRCSAPRRRNVHRV